MILSRYHLIQVYHTPFHQADYCCSDSHFRAPLVLCRSLWSSYVSCEVHRPAPFIFPVCCAVYVPSSFYVFSHNHIPTTTISRPTPRTAISRHPLRLALHHFSPHTISHLQISSRPLTLLLHTHRPLEAWLCEVVWIRDHASRECRLIVLRCSAYARIERRRVGWWWEEFRDFVDVGGHC